VRIPRDADMQHGVAKPVEPPFEVGMFISVQPKQAGTPDLFFELQLA
jgi:hypothetical protein